MSKCFLYGAASGGGGSVEIVVYANPGSEVVCTHGTTIKTATENNGVWTFKATPGVWIVSATLDGKTKTETVVAHSPRRYIVALSEIYLYNSGDECISVTGGWGIDGYVVGNRGNAAAQEKTDCLYFEGITGTTEPTVILGTLNAIDFTPFNTLEVTYEVLSNISGSTISADMRIGTAKTALSTIIADFGAPAGRVTKTYNVSGYSELLYFCIVCMRDSDNKVNVYSIKLS